MDIKGIIIGLVIGLILGGVGIGIYSAVDPNTDTSTVFPTSPENAPETAPETSPETTPLRQYLSYTVDTGRSNGGPPTVFNYEIINNQPYQIQKIESPFKASLIRIAYNSQLSVLELVGDYYYASNKNHYHLNQNFTNYRTQSFYNPIYSGNLLYVETVGTILVGGTSTGFSSGEIYSTQIVTPNSNWIENEGNSGFSKENNLLANYSSKANGYNYVATTVVGNCVYLTGGWNGLEATGGVQMIDFDGVTGFLDAGQREWLVLGSLQVPVTFGTMQFYQGKLILIGDDNLTNVQEFVLSDETSDARCNNYGSVFKTVTAYSGVRFPGSWVSDGNMTLFGGADSANCLQQTGTLNDLGNEYWGDSCLGSDKNENQTNLEGLIRGYAHRQSTSNYFMRT